MCNASHPFASNANGATEVTSADTVAEEQKLQGAINRVLLEHYAFTIGARTDLTCFSFLFDQVAEQLPERHPMDISRALYIRLHGGENQSAVAEAFSMGALIATAFRNRPVNYKPATVPTEKIDKSVSDYIAATMARESVTT